MSSIVQKLNKLGLLSAQQPFIFDTEYEAIMGSFAYGVSGNTSDIDLYAFCVPPKDYVFPHLTGYINGFGPSPQNFEVFQQHHIKIENEEKEYDIQVYSIVRMFHLCADGNPNMVDALFVPDRCVLLQSNIARLMRDRRRMFLHKGCYHRYKGYAYAQLKRLDNMKPVGKRIELVEKYGYDTKFAYHIVRLLLQAEQIMMEHDLNLERNSEVLKAIRNGEWTLERLKAWFEEKERILETLYTASTLRHSPDWDALRNLLLCCLEEKHGKVSNEIGNAAQNALAKLEMIRQIVEK